MKQGKLPTDVLAMLLARLPSRDPRVLVGPRVGEDAAALDLGDRVLVMAMDPITFATDLIGWYAVQVNANSDIGLWVMRYTLSSPRAAMMAQAGERQ